MKKEEILIYVYESRIDEYYLNNFPCILNFSESKIPTTEKQIANITISLEDLNLFLSIKNLINSIQIITWLIINIISKFNENLLVTIYLQ